MGRRMVDRLLGWLRSIPSCLRTTARLPARIQIHGTETFWKAGFRRHGIRRETTWNKMEKFMACYKGTSNKQVFHVYQPCCYNRGTDNWRVFNVRSKILWVTVLCVGINRCILHWRCRRAWCWRWNFPRRIPDEALWMELQENVENVNHIFVSRCRSYEFDVSWLWYKGYLWH